MDLTCSRSFLSKVIIFPFPSFGSKTGFWRTGILINSAVIGSQQEIGKLTTGHSICWLPTPGSALICRLPHSGIDAVNTWLFDANCQIRMLSECGLPSPQAINMLTLVNPKPILQLKKWSETHWRIFNLPLISCDSFFQDTVTLK